jgi:hypothetical protein
MINLQYPTPILRVWSLVTGIFFGFFKIIHTPFYLRCGEKRKDSIAWQKGQGIG